MNTTFTTNWIYLSNETASHLVKNYSADIPEDAYFDMDGTQTLELCFALHQEFIAGIEEPYNIKENLVAVIITDEDGEDNTNLCGIDF